MIISIYADFDNISYNKIFITNNFVVSSNNINHLFLGEKIYM